MVWKSDAQRKKLEIGCLVQLRVPFRKAISKSDVEEISMELGGASLESGVGWEAGAQYTTFRSLLRL